MEAYHVENFGCRASHADGDAIAAELSRQGATPAEGSGNASVVVVNTCSVTEEAERTARAYIRRVKRANPGVKIVLTGCYVQRAPEETAALPGVDAAIGNSHKSLVAPTTLDLLANGRWEGNAPERAAAFLPLTAIRGAAENSRALADDLFAHADLTTPALFSSRGTSPGPDTRPNLKVQDGCENRCSFCIIPTTRGGVRSLPLERVLESVTRFTEAGGKELVLSGINLGRWGRDLKPALRFEDLVAAILMRTSLPRLRISSVEPMDWTPALLELYRSFARDEASGSGPRLARHAHLPLQSGADSTLRAMHRRYRPWHYQEKVESLRSAVPDAAIGADVMVGFPGESDAAFEESYAFIAQQPYTYLHLFPFSARPGTPAWQLHRERPVPAPAVRERMERLRWLIAGKNEMFRRQFVGRSLPVVTLRSSAGVRERGHSQAISDNFIKIELTRPLLSNRMLRAHITSLGTDGLVASS